MSLAGSYVQLIVPQLDYNILSFVLKSISSPEIEAIIQRVTNLAAAVFQVGYPIFIWKILT